MLINRLDLLRCMQTVIKVVQQKGAIPTLSGVSLCSENNLLQVRGTDLETGMEAQSVCQGDLKPFYRLRCYWILSQNFQTIP